LQRFPYSAFRHRRAQQGLPGPSREDSSHTGTPGAGGRGRENGPTRPPAHAASESAHTDPRRKLSTPCDLCVVQERRGRIPNNLGAVTGADGGDQGPAQGRCITTWRDGVSRRPRARAIEGGRAIQIGRSETYRACSPPCAAQGSGAARGRSGAGGRVGAKKKSITRGLGSVGRDSSAAGRFVAKIRRIDRPHNTVSDKQHMMSAGSSSSVKRLRLQRFFLGIRLFEQILLSPHQQQCLFFFSSIIKKNLSVFGLRPAETKRIARHPIFIFFRSKP